MPIVSYVPLFMFAILFGLSMDYEVFLVSQIEEHLHAGEDNKSSVVSGLVTSARVITAAALIMVFVFGSFVLNGDPTMKQFGVGLAVAVVLDATVVRCLLVPALMILMGEHNWWLPALARPDRASPQHRGRGVLRRARRCGRGGGVARGGPGAGRAMTAIERRALGDSGVTLPRVALGCGNFGGVGSSPAFFGQGQSEDEAFALMDARVGAGAAALRHRGRVRRRALRDGDREVDRDARRPADADDEDLQPDGRGR